MEYRVTWTIDLDAESPEDAARRALTIHHDPDSWATHFQVRNPKGKTLEVDLEYPTGPNSPRTVHVLVPMEEGIVRDVQTYDTQEAAERAEREWLRQYRLLDAKERERASDWGSGIAIWECELQG